MLEDILILVPILLVLIMIFNIFIYALNYQRYKQSSYYRITRNPYFDILSDIGKSGEYSIYKKLKFLEKDRNKILFNLYIPRENNKFTEIDIVLLTAKGLFVIESKNFKGWIFGNENQKMWTQTLPSGYNCHKEQFYNPIKQNSTHIKYLRKIITDSIPIESIIVFSDSCTFKNVNVNVPASAVTNGTKIITANGNYDVTNFKKVNVVKIARPGRTTKEVFTYIKQNIYKNKNILSKIHDTDAIILDVGRNDYWGKQSPLYSITVLKRLVKFLKQNCGSKRKPFVTASTLIHVANSKPAQLNFVKQFNYELLKNPLITGEILQHTFPTTILGDDGLHPTPLGYTYIYKQVKEQMFTSLYNIMKLKEK